jgi:hypothetical protein
MLRVLRVVPLVLFVVGGLLMRLSGTAQAQAAKPQSLHVLEIDSEDADEQAEALTGAMRSRVRSAPGWVLLDTTQSLSMLTAALRCPSRPDTACLQRIGDQLKADRFVWGIISKAPGRQVTADIHLWTRGKPDQAIRESYSDNLKDQNDDTLRKIAGRFFDRLTGGAAATMNVHVASAGAPWVGEATLAADDNQKVPLDHGSAVIVLSGGPHVLEVHATGFTSLPQNVIAAPGVNQDLTFELTPVAIAPPPAAPVSNKRTVTWAVLVGGGTLIVASGVLGIVFEVERSKLNTERGNNYNTFSATPIQDPCNLMGIGPNPQTTAGCSAHNTAQAVEIPMIVSFGVGAALAATGIWLLTSDHKEGQAPASASTLHDVRILPALGPRGGSLGLSATF